MIYRKSSFCSAKIPDSPLQWWGGERGMPNNELLVNVGQINRISARIYCRLPPVTPSRPHSTPCTRSPVPLSFTPPPKKCIYMTVCLLARLNANKWRCMMTMGTVVTVNGFGWDGGEGRLREMDVGARIRTRERDGKREGRNTQRS